MTENLTWMQKLLLKLNQDVEKLQIWLKPPTSLNSYEFCFFNETSNLKWNICFDPLIVQEWKLKVQEIKQCLGEMSFFYLICEYYTDIEPIPGHHATSITWIDFLELIFPKVIAKLIYSYNEIAYQEVFDYISSEIESSFVPFTNIFAIEKWSQEEKRSNQNPLKILYTLMNHVENKNHFTLHVVSIYEEKNVDRWENIVWFEHGIFLIGKERVTLLHCSNEDDENIQFLWVGYIFEALLIIKNSRGTYYGGERYSFNYIMKSGENIQKSISFDGGFPSIAVIPSHRLIVLYTRKEIYIRTDGFERFTILPVTDDHHIANKMWNLECNEKLHFRYYCQKNKKNIYFVPNQCF